MAITGAAGRACTGGGPGAGAASAVSAVPPRSAQQSGGNSSLLIRRIKGPLRLFASPPLRISGREREVRG